MIFDLIVFVVGLASGFWLSFWLLYERQQKEEIERKITVGPSPKGRQEKMTAIRARVAERKARQSD